MRSTDDKLLDLAWALISTGSDRDSLPQYMKNLAIILNEHPEQLGDNKGIKVDPISILFDYKDRFMPVLISPANNDIISPEIEGRYPGLLEALSENRKIGKFSLFTSWIKYILCSPAKSTFEGETVVQPLAYYQLTVSEEILYFLMRYIAPHCANFYADLVSAIKEECAKVSDPLAFDPRPVQALISKLSDEENIGETQKTLFERMDARGYAFFLDAPLDLFLTAQNGSLDSGRALINQFFQIAYTVAKNLHDDGVRAGDQSKKDKAQKVLNHLRALSDGFKKGYLLIDQQGVLEGLHKVHVGVDTLERILNEQRHFISQFFAKGTARSWEIFYEQYGRFMKAQRATVTDQQGEDVQPGRHNTLHTA